MGTTSSQITQDKDIFDSIINVATLDDFKEILSPEDLKRRHCYGETLLHSVSSNHKIGGKIAYY